MKNILLKILSLVLFTSCVNYKYYQKTDAICGFNDTIYPEEFTLSYEGFIQSENDQSYCKFENDFFLKDIITHPIYNKTLFIEDKTSKIKKTLNYDNKTEKLKKSYFYYKGTPIGKKTHYNEKGQIIKQKDYRLKDKYPICFKEADRIVNKLKPYGTYVTKLYKDSIVSDKETIYTWDVSVNEDHKNNNDNFKAWSYIINAKTGKKIKSYRIFSGCLSISKSEYLRSRKLK